MLNKAEKQKILQDYSQGNLSTRAAIAKIGVKDYGDLITELSQHDLELPRLSASEANVRRATEILQPLLRSHAN